jgi:hypothetical protein
MVLPMSTASASICMARDIQTALAGTLELGPRTYGGTDAVWASQSGKPVVEGFGLPGGNYRSSEEEFVLVDRIPRRLLLAAEMMRAFRGPDSARLAATAAAIGRRRGIFSRPTPKLITSARQIPATRLR